MTQSNNLYFALWYISGIGSFIAIASMLANNTSQSVLLWVTCATISIVALAIAISIRNSIMQSIPVISFTRHVDRQQALDGNLARCYEKFYPFAMPNTVKHLGNAMNGYIPISAHPTQLMNMHHSSACNYKSQGMHTQLRVNNFIKSSNSQNAF
jgi:hypothetical protein